MEVSPHDFEDGICDAFQNILFDIKFKYAWAVFDHHWRNYVLLSPRNSPEVDRPDFDASVPDQMYKHCAAAVPEYDDDNHRHPWLFQDVIASSCRSLTQWANNRLMFEGAVVCKVNVGDIFTVRPSQLVEEAWARLQVESRHVRLTCASFQLYYTQYCVRDAEIVMHLDMSHSASS